MSLNNQSVRLADLGRREEALTAINEAVTAYRALAETRPDAFLPDLAMSLNNQSSMPGGPGTAGRGADRDQRSRHRRPGARETRPDAFLPDLAMSLNNQSSCLAGLGRREEALTAINEAVTAYRALAEPAPTPSSPTWQCR